MEDEPATTNLNRSYSLGTTCIAIFSFILTTGPRSATGSTMPSAAVSARRGDRLWLLGYTLLFLAPSLILFLVGLFVVAAAWLALRLVYLLFMMRYFPRVQTQVRWTTQR